MERQVMGAPLMWCASNLKKKHQAQNQVCGFETIKLMKFLCVESPPKGGGALKSRFDNVEDILGNVEGNLEKVFYKKNKQTKNLCKQLMDKNEICMINRRISLAKTLNVYIKNVCEAGM